MEAGPSPERKRSRPMGRLFALGAHNQPDLEREGAMIENNQTKSNGRGGARKGSGRKAGSATAKTREIADKAAENGITPLEVMLKAMHYSMGKFDETEVVDHLVAAAAFAKDAAPYIHPRLSAVEVDGKLKVSLADELAALNGAH